MAIWRIVRFFVRRSKGSIAWIWFSLMLLTLFALSPESWVSSVTFDAVRASLTVVPFFSRLLGRELAVLPIGRRAIWRAKWLIATVGVAGLTGSARLIAFYVLFGLSHVRPPLPLAMLGLADLLEAGVIAASVATLVGRRRLGRTETAFRLQRWLAGLTLVFAPGWGHVLDQQIMATRGAWTAGTVGFVLLGVGLTLWGATAPNLAYAGRDVDPQVAAPTAPPRRLQQGLRPSRGHGAIRFVGREVLGITGLMVAALAAIVVMERLVFGHSIGGRADSPDFLPALAIVLATSIPVTQRARLLRTLPLSTNLLVVLPTLLVAVAWATAAALFSGFYRLALGAWSPFPFTLTVLEMVALTSVVKSLSLPWTMRSLVPIVAVGPLFAIAVLLPPLDGHVAVAVVVSIGVIAGTIAADHYTFTRSKRVYERTRTLWG